jgi:hypothetical protein
MANGGGPEIGRGVVDCGHARYSSFSGSRICSSPSVAVGNRAAVGANNVRRR